MKRIGLLGGMSWESSAEYYRLVNEVTRARLGGLHSADCVLRSVDFAVVERLQREGRWTAAGALLAAEAVALVAAGAELIVLCTNTMHKVADAITAAVGVPFVHIADATAEAVTDAGLHRVGLLATAYTMEQDFYVGRLRERHGLTVIVPDEADRRIVHSVIYDELCRGVVDARSRAQYRRIIAAWPTAAPRESCWAAPRSTCSSGLRTRPFPSSTPPGCTHSVPSSSPWQTTKERHTRDPLCPQLPARRRTPPARRAAPVASRGGW